MSASATPLVLGTAGHIDHGKTALITRLTGTNTDRLREERERGISIELGYAELTLPGGRRLSVVDVPGHERFVRTMVAGATGVDLFLLVVAADDGVMPQTVEHLAILELLGVPRGVVVLTKADLVDDELLELVHADVVAFLAGTGYAATPVVTVSARDGRGIDDLLAALAAVAAEAAAASAARDSLPARLPIDRVFALKGPGTIVTGSLWRGTIAAGDALAIEPGGRRVVARSIQVHDRDDEVARAGSRVGVNLRGVERGDVERGQWLVAPELAGRATASFDSWLTLLPGARPLRSGDRVRLHHGTAQHLVRVQVLDEAAPSAGHSPASGAVVVRLDDGRAVVEPHDRFIVRSLSPVATIGGGIVLDARPPRWRDRRAHAAYCAALRAGDSSSALGMLVARAGLAGVAADDLEAVVAAGRGPEAAASREPEAVAGREPAVATGTDAVMSLLAAAEGEGRIERRAGRWFPAGTAAASAERVQAALRDRAKERPERPQAALAELAGVVEPYPLEALESLMADLETGGRVVQTAGGYAAVGGATLSARQEALAAAVVARLEAEPFAPPTFAVLLAEEGVQKRELGAVLDVARTRGLVVRVDRDLWFSAAAIEEARERLTEALARLPEITLAQFRDLLGTGRRNAQALLEHFDREGLTRREGEGRVLRTRRGPG